MLAETGRPGAGAALATFKILPWIIIFSLMAVSIPAPVWPQSFVSPLAGERGPAHPLAPIPALTLGQAF